MSDATVAALNVYPVKSCRGITLEEVRVERTGFAGDGVRDRQWMIVDRNGCFVTQREEPRLALIEAACVNGALEVRAPGCDAVRGCESSDSRDVVVWRSNVRGFDAGDPIAKALSTYLDRDVRLVRFDERKKRRCNPDYVGSSGATTLFADGYPILVIGAASLDDLNARLDEGGMSALPMNRFRPNLVLDGIEPYDEDHADTIRIGAVVLKPVKPCVRCEITTTDQVSTHRGIEPLRTLSTYRRNDRLGGVTFGMNAIVVEGEGARIARGDAAQVTLRF
ncbi:MAG TPA: MOSC N-terminal beta barrel domain-containing protein [Casimicrobiaceae bacterium]|nr:MOSC N-terminal beta barrel domain-containing protein [Casimicrobiaceae bacterium]